MKRRLAPKFSLVLGSGLLVATIAGCAPGTLNGTSGSSSHNQASGSASNQATNEVGVVTNTASGSGRTSNSTSGTSGSSGSAITIPKQKKLSYPIEGETDTRTATAYISSNQPFYMYVISDMFKASAEEPGKDIISVGQQDAWMRIEVLKGANMQQLAQNAQTTLKSTSSDVHPILQKDLPANPFFKNAQAWYANGSKVTAYVYDVDVNGTPVRFTLHVPREWESSIQFITMMETFHLVQPGQKVATA